MFVLYDGACADMLCKSLVIKSICMVSINS